MRRVFRDDIYDLAYSTLSDLYEEGYDGVLRDLKRLETATAAVVMYLHGQLPAVLLLDQLDIINTICLVYAGTEAFDYSRGPDLCAEAFRMAVEYKAAAKRGEVV